MSGSGPARVRSILRGHATPKVRGSFTDTVIRRLDLYDWDDVCCWLVRCRATGRISWHREPQTHINYQSHSQTRIHQLRKTHKPQLLENSAAEGDLRVQKSPNLHLTHQYPSTSLQSALKLTRAQTRRRVRGRKSTGDLEPKVSDGEESGRGHAQGCRIDW